MTHHRIDLIADPELHPIFRCTAPKDADCRRRPPDWENRDDWAVEEATVTGHPCWAVEWIDAGGIEDVLEVDPEGALASVPVSIHYDEGVIATPVVEPTNAEVDAAARALAAWDEAEDWGEAAQRGSAHLPDDILHALRDDG